MDKKDKREALLRALRLLGMSEAEAEAAAEEMEEAAAEEMEEAAAEEMEEAAAEARRTIEDADRYAGISLVSRLSEECEGHTHLQVLAACFTMLTVLVLNADSSALRTELLDSVRHAVEKMSRLVEGRDDEQTH